jgi:Ulp1 family protease
VQIYYTLRRSSFPLITGEIDVLKPEYLGTLATEGYVCDDVLDAYFALLQKASHGSPYRRKGKPITNFVEIWKLQLRMRSGSGVVMNFEELFDCTLLIVAVNIPSMHHWGLLALDVNARKFSYYDSSNKDLHIPQEVRDTIRVLDGFGRRTSLDCDLTKAPLTIAARFPQQVGGTDCGIFVMMAARALVNRFPFNFTQEDVPYFRQRFAAELVTSTLYTD